MTDNDIQSDDPIFKVDTTDPDPNPPSINSLPNIDSITSPRNTFDSRLARQSANDDRDMDRDAILRYLYRMSEDMYPGDIIRRYPIFMMRGDDKK